MKLLGLFATQNYSPKNVVFGNGDIRSYENSTALAAHDSENSTRAKLRSHLKIADFLLLLRPIRSLVVVASNLQPIRDSLL